MFNLMNFMQVLSNVQAADPGDGCGGLLFLVRIIRQGVFPILQIGVPIILIVLGTLDLAKAVISSDDKQVKEAQGKLIKRCIYAIAVFFIVTIVNLVLTMVGNIAGEDASGISSWRECWNAAGQS